MQASDSKKKLIILTGPTAVGKTELSIMLAKACHGEIISADSIQVYKHFDIGSAKVTREEMQGVPHHLIDILNPEDNFSVADFKEMTLEAMDKIYANGNIPVITGGTGFYIQAVLNDIDFTKVEDDGYRTSLEELYKQRGATYLYRMLAEIDPESLDVIHENNVKRVIRALEYYHQTGEKISTHNEREKKKATSYNSAYFVLNCNRALLYERIEKRVDIMLEQGLVDEVKHLVDTYKLTRKNTSLQGIGYKEILEYLDGNITLDEAIYILKRDTRHFAKRQLTWFKREKDVIWVDKDKLTTKEKQLEFMLSELSRRNIINER